MIEFRPAPNTPNPLDVVEVWLDGKMVATIYPHGENGIRVIVMRTVTARTTECIFCF